MRYRHLSPVERYQIEAGLALDMNPRWIADRIGRHVSTIYREFQRSPKHMRTHGYSGSVAHQYYNWNRKKSRRKHVITGKAKEYINNRLSLQWSPEQIAGRARKDGVVAAGTETIYRYVYRDRKQGGTLWKNLCRCRARRKKRFPRPQWPSKDQRLPASSRPIAIENRIRRGDFERDSIIGAGRSGSLLTLVDRKTKLVKILQPESLRPSDVHRATVKALESPRLGVKSITNDNGVEFRSHCITSKKLNVPIYFTRPYASWERGTVENTNGLIRQYFPKKQPLKGVTNERIKMVERLLNQRPRKTLNFKTPLEAHYSRHCR